MTPQEQRRQACQRVANVYVKICNDRFRCELPTSVNIDFSLCDRKPKAAGEASTAMNIALNDILLGEHESHILNITIPHEIAHLVVYSKFVHRGADVTGHGAEWQEVMRKLGKNPDKLHDLDVTKAVSHYRMIRKQKRAASKVSLKLWNALGAHL